MRATIDVMFDGRCGFCTRSAGWLERLDRHGRIRIHASQRPGALDRFGITAAAAAEAVWAFRVDRHGRRQSLRGAAAVALALDTALGIRILCPLATLPGMRALAERGYRWVADHRSRLRGVTPWCEAHPGECVPPS